MNVNKLFFNFWYRIRPPEMVHYWKESKGMIARTRISKEGHFEMEIKGEKYALKGFPRGYLMQSETGDYPLFSKVKHAVKNLIFNWAWDQLERNTDHSIIISTIKGHSLDSIFELFSGLKYHMMPYDRLVPSVKEFWRVMETLESESSRVKPLKELLCFILQEDDAYRYRFQWLVEAMNIRKEDNLNDICRKLQTGLEKMENAEVTDDMKGRIKLLRIVLLLLVRDKRIGNLAVKLFTGMDLKKVYLDKADKYHFRGKYFKVDHEKYDY